MALLLSIFLLPFSLCTLSSTVQAQTVTDKMVATVNGGVSQPDLITYSDLLWQLALQPDTPLDNPGSEILNRALQLLIDQHLILQEAERLPSIAPTDAEIKAALDEIAKRFPPSEFERRLRRVGFSSIEDERLREIIRQRVAIEKYLNFRFRSFTVVSPEEVASYYRDVFVPRFRQRNPGRLVPTLDQAREELQQTLTESKIESDTDAFLDTARERAEIVILNPV
jgi:parvulin-like peptidyl-prolyl isomerase